MAPEQSRYAAEYAASYLDTTCIWQHPGSPFPPDEPVPFISFEDNNDPMRLGRRNANHGRTSVDLTVNAPAGWILEPGGLPLFEREYKGNLLPTLTNMNIYSTTELTGAITIEEAMSTIEAIEWLHDIHLPSEAVTAVHQINTLLHEGHQIPIDKAKVLFAEHLKLKISDLHLRLLPLYQELSDKLGIPVDTIMGNKLSNLPNMLPELFTSWNKAFSIEHNIKNMEQFLATSLHTGFSLAVMERHFTVGERIGDIGWLSFSRQYRNFFAPIFSVLNYISETYGNCIPGLPAPTPFDANDTKDISRYFTHYLPTQMGAYLAILHANHMAHGNLHPLNWSPLGFAVDPVTLIGSHNGNTRGAHTRLPQTMHSDIINSAGWMLPLELQRFFRVQQLYSDTTNDYITTAVAQFAATYMDMRATRDSDFASLPGTGPWENRAWYLMFGSDFSEYIPNESETLKRTKELLDA